MNLTQLKSQLQVAIPEELYKIEPGQIVLFVPESGLTQRTAQMMADFFRYLRKLDKDNDISINVVQTKNELLIDTIAGRNPEETGVPYNVFVGNRNTAAGFAADYFGEDIKDVVSKVPSAGLTSQINVNATNLPVIVSINPEDCPAKEQHNEPAQFTCPFMGNAMWDNGNELLVVKPEKGSKEEKKFIAREAKKLEKVLRECAVLEIELDIDKIKRKVKESLKSDVEYQLSLDIDTTKIKGYKSICNTCDVYVADGEEYKLNLTAVEKAVYLTFLLYEDGIRIAETFDEFRQTTQKIYRQLPYNNDKCEKTAEGILGEGDVNPIVYTSTLRGYISNIRDEVADKISHPLVAQEFAIEGLKDDKFRVARSTSEIRAQIKKTFGL